MFCQAAELKGLNCNRNSLMILQYFLCGYLTHNIGMWGGHLCKAAVGLSGGE
jgi:hypothetical protein